MNQFQKEYGYFPLSLFTLICSRFKISVALMKLMSKMQSENLESTQQKIAKDLLKEKMFRYLGILSSFKEKKSRFFLNSFTECLTLALQPAKAVGLNYNV